MPQPVIVNDPSHPGVQLMREMVAAIGQSGCNHSTVLDVLHSLYGQLLLQHPCCWDGAADAALRLAGQLTQAANSAGDTAQAAIARAARRAH